MDYKEYNALAGQVQQKLMENARQAAWERQMQSVRAALAQEEAKAQAFQTRPQSVDERAFGVPRTTTAPTTTIGPSGMTFGTPFGTMRGQMAQTEYNRPLYSVGFSPNARPAQTAEDVQRIQSNAPTFGNMVGKVKSSPAGLQTQIEKLEKERFVIADNLNNANSEESRQAAQAAYNDINAQIEALTKQLDGALPSVPETIDGMTYVEAALDVSNKRSVGIYDPEAEARLEKFHTAQRVREDTEKYGTKLYNDDFSGQFGASYTNTTIAERANAAWARYADNPTEANRQVAENLSRMQEQFGRNNRNALDENATLPIVSQTLAGYLPQGLRQGAAMAVGGLAGAAVAGGAGAKIGMTIGSGVASYNSMKGAAFKTLIDLGVDEQTARAAANDEAVLSSIIEMGEAGITVFTAGANKLLQAAGKAGITSLGKVLAEKVGGGMLANLAVALGKYGINILSEGEEERLQQYISLANQQRMTEGNVDGGAWGLVKETAGLIGDALRGEAPEAREQASEAASEGRKLAALTGIFDVPANTVGGMQTGAQARQERNTQAAVQTPQTAEPVQAVQAVTPEQKPEAQPVQTPKTTAQIMEEAAQGMVGKPDDLGGSDTADGVGAKTSDFKHRVVDSQNHALGGVEARNAVPEDLRTQTTHDEITEAESLHNANLRLEQDYEGEKRYLENTVSWTGEDVDVGMKILEDLSREAHNTGDWTEYTRWRKVFDLHKEEIGRSLQALAKYARLTGDRIIENASKLLDDARDGTDVSEVMDTVATFSAAFDEAAAKNDVDRLVQIIRDTAQTRNMSGLVRSVFGKSGLPKEIDWAINRIAELAVGDLQKYEANPTAAPVVRRFSVGDRVSPSNRNNVGTIVADHGDGTYSVRFVNPKTKAEATKKFSIEQLQPTDKTKKNSLSFPAEKHDVGKYYDFLKKFAANSIEAIAADKKKLSGGKAAKTLRYNAMLSKASTVLRNLVNNGVLDGLDTLARDASVPLDMLISRLTGTRSVAVDKGWFSEAKRNGALDGLAFALMECGLDVDTSGSYNKYENGAGRTFKMSGSPVERLLSSWEKLTAYNMSVTDEVSKGATEAEIQRGIDELRAKGKIKDDSLGGAGAQEARYRTLQDDTVLSKAVSDLRKTANRWKIAGFGLGDLALPFTKVPANVPMRVMDYSPAGLATGMFRMAQVLKSAKDGTLTAAEQARAVQSIGRGMTGTAVIAGLTALAAKGLIRTMDAGGKEENRDRAASLKSQGLSGTQWNLSATLRDAEGKENGWKHGDTILSVGFLEPFNAHMAIASLIAEDMKDGLTAGEIVTDTLSGVYQSVLELPVMQVFQDVDNAIRYSDGETGGERALDAVKTFLAGQATSWIPNSLKGIAQGLDPMQRDLYASDDPLKQVVDNFKGSIPKLREQTSAKLDVYGNPVENENRAMNFLNANVNPGSVGTYQTTPTTDVLNRVYEATGESSVYLSSSDLSEVKDVALDESQKRQFQTDRGDTYEAVVPAIGGDKNFWNLPNDMQVAILSVAEEYATQTAKEKLGVGYETESWVQELAGKSAEEIARECIKKGVERVGGLGKPIKFDASWAVVSGDVMDGAMKKAQAYADAVALEEMGYPMETDWMLKAKEAKTDKERQDLFMVAAVDAQAKKLGDGNKYVGLSEMLEDGDVDDKTAILVLPPDVVKRKTDRKIKVSATLLVDALAFKNSDAASSGKKDKNGKYLDGEGPQDKVYEYLRKDRRLSTSQANKVMACLYEGWGR